MRVLVLDGFGLVVNVILADAVPAPADGLSYVSAVGPLAGAGIDWTVVGSAATPPPPPPVEPDTPEGLAAELAALQARLAALLEQGT